MLDALETEENSVSKASLDNVFGGQLETLITCQRCHNQSSSSTELNGLLTVSVPDDRIIRKNETQPVLNTLQKPVSTLPLDPGPISSVRDTWWRGRV